MDLDNISSLTQELIILSLSYNDRNQFRSDQIFYVCYNMVVAHFPNSSITLVNVNAPVVATTSWWLHFLAPVVA